MNILFVYCDTVEDPFFKRNPRKPLFTQMDIQMGISYLASFLKQNRHQTDLLVVTGHTTTKDLDQAITGFKPGLICFTAVFREFETIVRLAEYFKTTYPAVFLLAGGPHVSLNPETAIQKSFDAICIGEGEYPVFELVEQLEQGISPERIDNLWIKTETGIEKNPTRPFIQDLDRLPFPDRDIWQKWINSNTFHFVLLGRGCPFNCTYCCNHALKRIAEGKYVRFRSPQNIIAEIKELTRQFADISHIYLEVEAINLNINFLTEFCSQMEVYNQSIGNRISYGTNFRIIPSQNIENIFKLLQKININEINIGLESGNERIRQEMMHRDYSNDDVRYVVKTAKEFGFSIMLYVMIGIPTETEGEFQDTIDLAEECNPEIVQLNIFCPYPGTALYNYCLKYKIITGEVKDRGRHVAGIDLPGFSARKIQQEYDDFMARFGPVSFQYAKKRKK